MTRRDKDWAEKNAPNNVVMILVLDNCAAIRATVGLELSASVAMILHASMLHENAVSTPILYFGKKTH